MAIPASRDEVALPATVPAARKTLEDYRSAHCGARWTAGYPASFRLIVAPGAQARQIAARPHAMDMRPNR
jgi:hypothetical protein